MDLGGWVRSLGLEKYEAVLRDSEIDKALLHNLTEDRLRELGFQLGAWPKLLNAIATHGSPNPATPTEVKLLPTPSTNRHVASRRAPYAAFCDLCHTIPGEVRF
jgi:SAM domain (Sterile alpha motif)